MDSLSLLISSHITKTKANYNVSIKLKGVQEDIGRDKGTIFSGVVNMTVLYKLILDE